MGNKKPFPQDITDFMNEIEKSVTSGSSRQLDDFIQNTFPDHAPSFPSTTWENFISNSHIRFWEKVRHKTEPERWNHLIESAKKACLADSLFVITMDYFD